MPTTRAATTSGRRGSRPGFSPNRHWRVGLLWLVLDGIVAALATGAAAWIRYDLDIPDVFTVPIFWFAVTVGLIQIVTGVLVGPHRFAHNLGSFEETADIMKAVFLTMVISCVLRFGTSTFQIPRSLPFAAPAFALVGMFALRFFVRSYRWGRPASGVGEQKAIVFGAGEGGRQLVRALVRDGQRQYTPVAILDDDPRKRRMRIDGVPVRGGRNRLRTVTEKSGATVLIIAMPSADADLVRDLRDAAHDIGLELLILPPVASLLGNGASVRDLREVNLEDLLGRRQIALDEGAIAASVAGKRILVTGAGGSIGSELCRQISRFNPAKLTMLDRDESGLHGTQMSITGRALLDDGTLALADIRDLDALRAIFAKERPDVVFHAAALKHLTLLEQHPNEGWKTNVLGTLNVLTAASEVGVETFVNISTDKAASPTCVLGYTKRMAERLTAQFAVDNPGTYTSVRFGNVLGSRGSVLTAFMAQIERGGPVTVTDENVERYFMLIPEACQLVLQASVIGDDGQVMVLDMGSPVKIVDVARALIDMSGREDIAIEFTGLRPGEKLSEVLFYEGEQARLSPHPLVSYVTVPPVDSDAVRGFAAHSSEKTLNWLITESMSYSRPETNV
ncbi:nucleoside-diphosphate sugar epimerase/dehydratase [Rudaeicoccus suwonensis]|uniref:FlaA1/EpsC-like NDP-sugar epimerase n=1 Tax=Rudaeicoccus suwonensis TaxID=657409 RepID=A0A561E8T9_9MICO|nr:nucleoside-diphosphate sugar epimerase/dehydratase [Rudaeicoccus suwonensis]TWE12021.1 FlaA1/EpsC-like NDP-sugar epimerase [Rudaeicoccus suwonensis]